MKAFKRPHCGGEFRSTLGRLADVCAIMAKGDHKDDRVTIFGTRHLLVAWHWNPRKQ